MPTFVTRESYACSHSVETSKVVLGTDAATMIETIPIPSQCLQCVCRSLLDTVFPLDADDDDIGSDSDSDDNDSSQFLDRVPLLHMSELVEHLQTLIRKQRRSMVVGKRGGYAAGVKQMRDLEKLRSSVLAPADAGEFRATLLALTGFQFEVDPCFFI
ncbi:uncharacterized protein GGS25DRAFT_260340 [Hypoxylon fragiforme]|uniref:uncharacterized protein n=1 Tax=Hypoxylon fragiforme TaxID=63214 RepID=UPI0020C5C964|nr:uncharacterized protein GGS25DRAFT_260340 [Hypoxylon fragiforme]KAI2608064.1 hypothetical protein GGS25DRAFT_260340 [Hypoxylon fragiforme]